MWRFPANFDHQQMAMIANTLPNDQAIADVVAYIGTLDAPAPPRTETGGDLARGAEYYTYGLIHTAGYRLSSINVAGGTSVRPDTTASALDQHAY